MRGIGAAVTLIAGCALDTESDGLYGIVLIICAVGVALILSSFVLDALRQMCSEKKKETKPRKFYNYDLSK